MCTLTGRTCELIEACGTGHEVVLLQVEGYRSRLQGHPVWQSQDHQQCWCDCLRNAIISMECFNDCLMKVVVADEQRMYHFVSAHAQQSGCSERAKEEFGPCLMKRQQSYHQKTLSLSQNLNGHVGTANDG